MAVITVAGGRYNVENVFQWDKNQLLEIRGLSLAKKPEVHFIQENLMDRAIVKQSEMDSTGVITVTIPNSLLQNAQPIKVYVCGYEETTFKTYCDVVVSVIPRGKPADYKLDNDPELYSFTELEYKVNNFNSNVLTTVKGWVANNLITTKEGKVLDARQGKVLFDRLKKEEAKSGNLNELTTTDKTTLVSAINLVNTGLSNLRTSLTKLIDDVKLNLTNALQMHKWEGDHDSRYYQKTEIDSKTGDLNTLTTNSKVITDAINELKTTAEGGGTALTALGTHKTSGDHDSRYYQKTEVDQVLQGKQDKLVGTPLTTDSIVDDLQTTTQGKVLSAKQGVTLSRMISRSNDRHTTHLVNAGSGIKLSFENRFTGFITTDVEGLRDCCSLYYVSSFGPKPEDIIAYPIQNVTGSALRVMVSGNSKSIEISSLSGNTFHVGVLTISGNPPIKGVI